MSNVIASTRVRLCRFKGRYPEICQKSGLDYSWVSKFACGERGKRPEFDQMTKLIGALDAMEAADQAEKTPATTD